MGHFHTPIGAYARGPLQTVRPDTPLPAIHALFEERGISAVPVVDPAKGPLGVVSRTDLLRVGTPRPRRGEQRPERAALVDFPETKLAADVMHEGVVALRREATVAEAAGRMVHDRIHRVFVTDDGRLDQVFGTREIMEAVWESRVATPIGMVMSRKPFTIPVTASLADATARLEQAHAQGLVVVDEERWPIGVFTQREALLARDQDPTASVELGMSHALLCLHRTTPLHRAAAQAAVTRARRVLVIDDKEAVGVVTGLDFARLARG